MESNPVVLYDIGANVGFIGIGLVRRNLADYVVSFEPDPQNYQYLLRNIEDNGLRQKVFPLNIAVSDRCELVPMDVADHNHGDHRISRNPPRVDAVTGEDGRRQIKVEAHSLDRLPWHSYSIPSELAKPSVIWMDVQGYEGFAMKGGVDLLSNNVPAVIEVSPHLIQRAGMSLDEYEECVKALWRFFYVDRHGFIVRYEISRFGDLVAELSQNPYQYATVIVMNQ